MTADLSPSCVLLVPVKRWERAKSRLVIPDTVDRRRLIEAFARDAIAAATHCPLVAAVYVVTDQAGFEPASARVLPDEGDGDLNAALRAAAARVAPLHPGLAVAAMCADLPCLTAEELSAGLAASRGLRGFVADVEGTGTTLLVGAPGEELDPRFGPGSAGLHRESGRLQVVAPVPGLRLDVDTGADLDAARALGVGPHTAAVLA